MISIELFIQYSLKNNEDKYGIILKLKRKMIILFNIIFILYLNIVKFYDNILLKTTKIKN